MSLWPTHIEDQFQEQNQSEESLFCRHLTEVYSGLPRPSHLKCRIRWCVREWIRQKISYSVAIPSTSLHPASVLHRHPFNITPSCNDPTLVISSILHQSQTDIPSISLYHASVLQQHPFNITPSYISHPFNITPSYVSPTLTSLQHHSILHQSYTDIPSKSLHPTSVLHWHPFKITPSYISPTSTSFQHHSILHQSYTDIPSTSLHPTSVLHRHPFNITPSYISPTPTSLQHHSILHQSYIDILSTSLHPTSVLHRHPFNITPSYFSPTSTSLQHHSILHQSYTDIPSKSLHPTSVLHRHPFNITPSYISPTPTSLQHHSILHQSYTDIPSTSLHPTSVLHRHPFNIAPSHSSRAQLQPTSPTYISIGNSASLSLTTNQHHFFLRSRRPTCGSQSSYPLLSLSLLAACNLAVDSMGTERVARVVRRPASRYSQTRAGKHWLGAVCDGKRSRQWLEPWTKQQADYYNRSDAVREVCGKVPDGRWRCGLNVAPVL